MTQKHSRFSAFLILLAVLAGFFTPAVRADSVPDVRTVIGADLTEEQVAQVYEAFGFERGSVPELTLTSEEEHRYLQGLVDDAVIGTRTLSCVYMEKTGPGSGISVKTVNITQYTEDMYRNALETAGISDVRCVAASAIPVSGSGALAGMFKAYEDLTGTDVSEEAIKVSTEELITTGDLTKELDSGKIADVLGDLKGILNEIGNMSDRELREKVQEISAGYGLTLTDAQADRLVHLCRQLESLGSSEVFQKADDLKETVEHLGEKAEDLKSFAEKVSDFFQRAAAFFRRLIGS